MKITKGMYTQMIKQNGGGFYWEEEGVIHVLSRSDIQFYTVKGALAKRNIDAILSLENGMTLKGTVKHHHNTNDFDSMEFTGDFEKFAPVLHEIHAFCEIIDNKYAIVHLDEEQKRSLEKLKSLARDQTNKEGQKK